MMRGWWFIFWTMDSVFGLCVCICEAVWGPVVRVVGSRLVHVDVSIATCPHVCVLCCYVYTVVTPRVLLTCVPSLAPSADGILKHILRLKVAADRVSLDARLSLARLNRTKISNAHAHAARAHMTHTTRLTSKKDFK